MHIAVLVYDGFDELDAVGPYEVFENAVDAGANATVSLCSLDPTDRVTASHGLRIEPEMSLDDVDPRMVVVPGGGWNARAEAGAWAEAEQGDLPETLARYHDYGATIAAVCTGGMILERAGLLDGRPATTHAGALAELRESNATVIDARVVDDGDVLTAGGVTSGLDLALHVVEREFGRDVAESVSTTMEYERQGEVYHG